MAENIAATILHEGYAGAVQLRLADRGCSEKVGESCRPWLKTLDGQEHTDRFTRLLARSPSAISRRPEGRGKCLARCFGERADISSDDCLYRESGHASGAREARSGARAGLWNRHAGQCVYPDGL